MGSPKACEHMITKIHPRRADTQANLQSEGISFLYTAICGVTIHGETNRTMDAEAFAFIPQQHEKTCEKSDKVAHESYKKAARIDYSLLFVTHKQINPCQK